MKQPVVLAMLVCLGAGSSLNDLGDSEAIYGRLQRNSYVPYPKPDYTRLYLALKNARLRDPEQLEPEYDYGNRAIGAIFEAPEEAMQYDDTRDDIPNQQQWIDYTGLYEAPIDEEQLQQQQEKDLVRQFMSNFIDKKSEAKKAGIAATVKPKATLPTVTSTKAPQRAKQEQHKEDKIPKVSKLHGQKEYAMLRPAGAEARRPLPDLWPEDADVQQLKRAARRLFRKTSPPATDELTSELDSLNPHQKQIRKRSLLKN